MQFQHPLYQPNHLVGPRLVGLELGDQVSEVGKKRRRGQDGAPVTRRLSVRSLIAVGSQIKSHAVLTGGRNDLLPAIPHARRDGPNRLIRSLPGRVLKAPFLSC
jgi:hypothetical protein